MPPAGSCRPAPAVWPTQAFGEKTPGVRPAAMTGGIQPGADAIEASARVAHDNLDFSGRISGIMDTSRVARSLAPSSVPHFGIRTV